MWQKSAIQQLTEKQNTISLFKNKINNIMENWSVDDDVFKIDRLNGAIDVVEGYFCPLQEYDTLDEAAKYLNNDNQYIRITENVKFTVGAVYQHISDCISKGFTTVWNISDGNTIEL